MADEDQTLTHAVLSALDLGLIVVDHERRVVLWNEWVASATRIEPDRALGRTLDELFPDLQESRLFETITDALESGASSVLSHSLTPDLLPLHHRGGGKLLHNVVVRALPGNGRTSCLVQINDVTAAVEREQVLRKRQNARYRAVVDTAPDAIVTTTADGTIQWMNAAAERQFCYSSAEAIGQNAGLLLDLDVAWSALAEGAETGDGAIRPREVLGKRKDGSLTHLELSASAWRSEGRSFVTGILRDINERKRSEQALRQFNEALEQRVAERTADRDRMWRLSQDLLVVLHPEGGITSANPAWAALLGWSETELQQRCLLDLTHPDDRDVAADALARLVLGESVVRFDARLQHKFETHRTIAWTAVRDADLTHAVGRDITAEKESAEALLQAEEQLRQAQKMEAVGQLTGGIAHDFNNLLTGIVGSLDLMQTRINQGRTENLSRYINAATSSANRAAALTHRLLAFARRQPLDPKPVNADALIGSMRDLLRSTMHESVSLEIVTAGGLWMTLCDPHQLESAILNLAINARDAMPAGGKLTIETCNTHLDRAYAAQHPEVQPGQYICICVTDTGTGMPPEVIARAFDPFFTTKPIGQGTGLGLSMIYGFARQSEGHAKIYSEVGKGTTVKIYLPRHRGPIKDEAVLPRVMPVPWAGADETVLVVEDEAVVRDLVVEVLEDLGYRALEAPDGTRGLNILQSGARIDLLVTDVGLPGMNGRQLADQARETRPGLKVLFITGYAENAALASGFLEPGMEMITKPFPVDALAQRIREMIESKRNP
jgi:PAS domain S-box-containing protein